MRPDDKSPFTMLMYGGNGVQFIPRIHNDLEKSFEASKENKGIEEPLLVKTPGMISSPEGRENQKGDAIFSYSSLQHS